MSWNKLDYFLRATKPSKIRPEPNSKTGNGNGTTVGGGKIPSVLKPPAAVMDGKKSGLKFASSVLIENALMPKPADNA